MHAVFAVCIYAVILPNTLTLNFPIPHSVPRGRYSFNKWHSWKPRRRHLCTTYAPRHIYAYAPLMHHRLCTTQAALMLVSSTSLLPPLLYSPPVQYIIYTLTVQTMQWPTWPLFLRTASLRTGCAQACAAPITPFPAIQREEGRVPYCIAPTPELVRERRHKRWKHRTCGTRWLVGRPLLRLRF